MLIVGEIAASQHATVAHSAGYGPGRPRISKAPAGAKENHGSKTRFFRPLRGMDYFNHLIPTVFIVGDCRPLLRSSDYAFSVSHSILPEVEKYIENQKEHHRKISFQDEFVMFLKRHEIKYDEKFLWE